MWSVHAKLSSASTPTVRRARALPSSDAVHASPHARAITQEAEEAGFRRYAERVGALRQRVGTLPPPQWWQDLADAQLAVGVTGGAAAARVHALLSPLWSIDMPPNNKALVVVRDDGLTLFSASDEFSSPRADWEGLPVSGERGFQWRRVAWSPDSSTLAVSEANGSATLLSVNTFRATARIPTLLPTRAPAAAIAFIDTGVAAGRVDMQALLALSYDCVLYTHPVAMGQRANQGSRPTAMAGSAEPLDLSPYHTFVTCLAVAPASSLIAIGGGGPTAAASSRAAGAAAPEPSLSVWKVSTDGNSYSLQFATGRQQGLGSAKASVLGRLMGSLGGGARSWCGIESAVIKLSFHPSAPLLVALQLCGSISVVDTEARKITHCFAASGIPLPPVALADVDGGAGAAMAQRAAGDASWVEMDGIVGDVSWWDSSSLVLARRNGFVTVNSIQSGLENLLKAPLGGCLHYQPMVTNAVTADEGALFMLDCRRRLRTSEPGAGEQVGASFGAVDSGSWLTRVLAGDVRARSWGGVEGGEHFVRRYRLVSVCKTTLERLVQRKLDLNDFASALDLARRHALNTDPVFMRQWESSEVSQQSIDAYLSKVSDRQWVLEQCCARLPPSCQGARELCAFGLACCQAAVADASDLDDADVTAERRSVLERCQAVLSRRVSCLQLYQLIYPGDGLDARRLLWFGLRV